MPTPAPITALVYSDGNAADLALCAIAGELQDRGFKLAGLVQHNVHRSDRSRCNMVLEDLATGEQIGIAEDRGPLARGCALDVDRLLAAMRMVENAITDVPDLVILNKYGKTESEGSGFRPLIADIVERGLPLLIAVPRRNINNWRRFAGELAGEYPVDDLPATGRSLCDALGLIDQMAARRDNGGQIAEEPRISASERGIRPLELFRL